MSFYRFVHVYLKHVRFGLCMSVRPYDRFSQGRAIADLGIGCEWFEVATSKY